MSQNLARVTCWALGWLALAAALAGAVQVAAVEFASHSAPGALGDGQILKGSDGNLYFTQPGNRLARVTPNGLVNRKRLGAPGESAIGGLALGASEDLWITDPVAGSIGILKLQGMAPRAKASMAEHELPKGFQPQHIVPGQDGNLWVSDQARGRLLWVRGTFFIEYKIPTPNAQLGGMVIGSDGNLWFTQTNLGKIGRAMPGGIISEFPLLAPGSRPSGITAGPDGGVWFTDPGTNSIGRIDPDTLVVATFPIAAAGANPQHITPGSDGNVWFTAAANNSINRVTPEGVISAFALPEGAEGIEAPGALIAGHDGNLWFLAKDKIGVFKHPGFAAPSALPSVFSFEVATHTEFESARSVAVVIKRSGNTTTSASVRYAISDSNASAGEAAVSAGTLNFAPDEVAKLVSVPIAEERATTPERSFRVRLSDPSENAALGPTPETVITITDPEAPPEETAPAPASGSMG